MEKTKNFWEENLDGATLFAVSPRETFNSLQQEYLASRGSPFEKLRASLKALREGPVAAVVVFKGFVYLGLSGPGQIVLERGGKRSRLLTGEEGEIQTISGERRKEDVFLLENSVGRGEIREVKEVRGYLGKKFPALLSELSLKAAKIAPPLPKGFGRARRTSSSVGIILLVLLLISIGFGLRQKGIREYKATYAERLSRAETLYADSVLQKDVNPQQAREFFLEASLLVEQLLAKGVKDRRLEELAAQLAQQKSSVLGEVKVEPQTLLDLSLVRSGLKATEMVLDEGILAVLDTEGKRIILLSETGKDNLVIGGPEKLGEVQELALYSGRNFVFGSRGVVEIGRHGEEKVVVEADGEWGEIAQLSAFGGNLYLLDKGNKGGKGGMIWRYPGIEGGFGAKQRWLGAGVEPDFSLAVDMAIDGSIWVLSSSGKVLKFTRGAPEAVNIQGLDKELSQPGAIYTDENLESFYILDSGNDRVVEISKDKEYQKQYLWEEMGEVRDIVASKEAGKIFLLTETKILEIPL